MIHLKNTHIGDDLGIPNFKIRKRREEKLLIIHIVKVSIIVYNYEGKECRY